MSGHSTDLNPKQQAALTQFRDKVKDVLQPHHDDAYLLRWLRARCFDLKKSEKMLRDSLEWRKKMGADDILNWTPPEVLQKYYPGGLYGVDKHGFPIWIDAMGFLDLKGILFSVRKSDILKYKVYWTERMYMAIDEQKKKLGREIDGVALIFDMEGIGTNYLWKPAVDVVSEIMCTFEANYPETLQYALVINAPKIFPIVYNLMKPFLSEDTRKKIHVLGDGWRSTVLTHIDADQLPVRWGGTQTDPDGDPCCRSRVNMGGEIPKEYYMEKPTKVDLSNFSSVTVARGSTAQLEYTVVESDSVLNWQFWTEDNDVGFGVFRRTCCERQKAGDMVEVVASQRVNSHFVPEHGSATCDTPGTYVIRFDNTYSWMRTKKVCYMVEVLAPGAMNDIDIKGSQSFQSFYSANSDVMSNTSVTIKC